MKLKTYFCLILSLLLPVSILFAQDPMLEDITAHDIDNWGNGADIEVRFVTDVLDSELRILVVPDGTTLDVATASTLAHYVSITPDSETVSLVLDTDTHDSEGNLITEGMPYQVYVLDVDNEILSEPSASVTLHNEAVVRTLVPELQAAAGGLETDAEGNVYFADFGEPELARGITVYRITPDGEVDVYLRGEGLEVSTGNAFDADGNFYQSSFQGDRIVRVAPDGEVMTFADEGLSGPVGITIDDENTLYVANCRNNTVQKITADGESTLFVRSSLLLCPNGITRDADGNLYVSNFRNARIIRITPDGEAERFASLTGSNNAHILYHDGILYAASRGGNQIFTVSLEGDVTLLAGTGERGNQDGTALEATFSLPNDLSISPDGRILYINEVVATTEAINFPSVVRAIVLPRSE